MTTLHSIIQDKQTAVFEEMGAFFAFSKEQFERQREPDTKYVNLGAGLIVKKGNEVQLIDKLDSIYSDGIVEDVRINGIPKIIRRELLNHECFITMSIEDTKTALEGYGITEEQIRKVFGEMLESGEAEELC